MENTIKDLEKSQKEISVTVSNDEMQKYIEKATGEIAKSIELDGFRKGKVPKDVVRQKIDAEKIYEEATQIAIEETYLEILKANPKIVPLGQPRAEIIKMAVGNDFEYKMTVSVMPEVKLGDYKKIAEKKEVKKVDEKRIEDELKALQKRKSSFITKDEVAAMGDRVEIDFEVRVGGVKIEGGESKNHPLVVGENKFIPGFEDQLIGMKKDETKEFELKFPDNYKEDLAGKMATFKVKLDLVQKVEMPKIDDDFAKSFGEIKSLAELKENMKKGMEAEEEHRAEHEMEHRIIDAVVKDMKVEIPQILIDSEVNNMIAEFKGNISQSGMDFDEYLKSANATLESLHEEWKPLAEKKVKENLAIREIAILEDIKAEEEEITKQVDETLKHYPNAEEIRKKIDMHRFRDYIAGDILRGKVMDFMKKIGEKK
ncbi:MAG: trigger factor [Candidatus Pacebacteria bacterium]|nr:trigger factor [Candidatus Paceibacterota bacterium]